VGLDSVFVAATENAALLVLEKMTLDKFVRMELIWANSKYHNDKLYAWLERHWPG